jgi:phenylpyruvate tautomerase PptA (4-oxalocrotonate tautomerase family)
MPTVHRATWQLLRALGVRTVFGNPGSTEMPFLADFPSDVDYVLALHEGAAVGMADAYAQLTGAPALVNLHTAVGVGNAMGAIVNAARSHSPLVITAGQQVRAMLTMQPFLANPDATALPKPAVKWAFEPPRAQDVPAALAGHDLILVVGAEVFAYYPYAPGSYLPHGAELVAILDDPDAAAHAPVGEAIVADPALVLLGLAELLPQTTRPAPAPHSHAAIACPLDSLSAHQVFDIVGQLFPANAAPDGLRLHRPATRLLPPHPRGNGLAHPGTFPPITKGQPMPIYRCSSPQRLLTTSAKAEIASEITRIHCEVTGERPSFVNVLFLDIPDGTSFTAGRPSTRSFVFGEIRHGHDIRTRHALLRQLSQMWTRLTNQSEAELIVGLTETPAENATQAGLMFAEPGHEQQWFDENHAKLTELGLL